MRKTTTPISVYYKYQQVFLDIVKDMQSPVIWNTQRQMGKSTTLAKIAAQYLRDGDVWFVGPNHQSEEQFLEKVAKELPNDAHVRKTKSRIELATLDQINFIGSPTKFAKKLTDSPNEVKYNQPVLVIVDELMHTPLTRLDRIIDYLDKTPSNIKFVAVTTGIGDTDQIWVKNNFGRAEVITTAFESVNIWTEDALGKMATDEVLRT